MTVTPEAHPAHVRLARVFSSVTLLGPPMGDKLLRLVAHLFAPEEAAVAVYVPFYYPRPLSSIARKTRSSPEDLAPLLDRMGDRRVILRSQKRYALLPIIPGMFEYMLMDGSDSEWHRKYAELLNDLFSTGYMRDYSGARVSVVRNIPVQRSIEHKNHVVDADLMSELLRHHAHFAVINVCQCRQSLHFVGKRCKRSKPEDGCLLFGSFARDSVKSGDARRVTREEMQNIADDRWKKTLVFLTANVSPESPNAICTCCDCCCHLLEAVNHYDGMSVLAPPHFVAAVDDTLCDTCGKCKLACNTRAHGIEKKQHVYDSSRCIGCGTCLDVCEPGAISMVQNPRYRTPARDLRALGIRALPATAIAGLKAKLSR